MEQYTERESEIGFDTIEGAEIMMMAGITSDDLAIPQRLEKVKDVVDFFKGHEDKGYLIKKLLMGKAVDSVDHLHEYVGLRRAFNQQITDLRSLEQEIALFE